MRARQPVAPASVLDASRAAWYPRGLMTWTSTLSYTVSPKSGPIRQLQTLEDARSALINDLPVDRKKAPHWLRAGMLVVAAGESGSAPDIAAATEALVRALDADGWMSHLPAP